MRRKETTDKDKEGRKDKDEERHIDQRKRERHRSRRNTKKKREKESERTRNRERNDRERDRETQPLAPFPPSSPLLPSQLPLTQTLLTRMEDILDGMINRKRSYVEGEDLVTSGDSLGEFSLSCGEV